MTAISVFEVVYGAMFGAAIGSYLTCALWRIPRHMSLLGRSICPHCDGQLRAQWNIPIIGWLALQGTSACCGERISIRYPLIETAAAAAGVASATTFGLPATGIAALAITAATVAISYFTRGRKL